MSDETKPPKAETVKSVDTKTPAEWATLLGHAPKSVEGVEWVGTLAESGMSEAKFSMAHEIASVLHGWPSHAHHANEPIQLTRADYEAALKAAFPEDRYEMDGDKPKLDRRGNAVIAKGGHGGNPKPHRAALSKYHPAFKALTERA